MLAFSMMPDPSFAAATQVVAVGKDLLPGSTLGLGEMENPILSNNGHVIFASNLRENGVLRGSGIFRAGTSTPGLQVIAQKGAASPDQNGYFGDITRPRLLVNSRGEVAFQTTLVGTLRPNQGDSQVIFRANAENQLTEIARGSQFVPGTTTRFSFFGPHLALNDAGTIAFTSDSLSLSGVFHADGTNLTTVAVLGDPTPISPFRYRQFNGTEHGLALSGSGELVFGADDDDSLRTGFYRFDGTTPVKIVREGDPIPGDDAVVNMIRVPSLNDAGQAAFVARVRYPDFTAEDGIFRADAAGLVTIARRGDFTPERNGRLLDFGQGVALTPSGQVLFGASITGSTNQSDLGVFLGDGTTVKTIVRKGNAAPGGGTIAEVGGLAINRSGQILILANVSGSSLGTLAAFLHDPARGLIPVVWNGSDLPGLGRISQLFFQPGAGLTGGAQSCLNDSGQVAYRCFVGPTSAIVRWSFAELVDNKPPTSSHFSVVANQGQVLQLSVSNLLAVVTDPEGGRLTVGSVSNPSAKGNTVSYDSANQRVNYQPAAGFLGEDEFHCVILDDAGHSVSVPVRVTVLPPNRVPTTTGVTRTLRVGQALTLSVAEILAAVDDPDGDSLSILSMPAATRNGGAIARDGDMIRAAARIEVSDDRFDVTVGDGRGGSVLVTIYIEAPEGFASLTLGSGEVSFRLSLGTGTWNLERAESPAGPWRVIGTTTITEPVGPRRGCVVDCVRSYPVFRDASPRSPTAFYRAVRVP